MLIDDYKDRKTEGEFKNEVKSLGKCPNCGGDVVSGTYGAYCSEKCGMSLSKLMGKKLSDNQVTSLLKGKKVLLKGLKSSKGKNYDAYVTPAGIEPYSFMGKDGNEVKGFRYKVNIEFPQRKKK